MRSIFVIVAIFFLGVVITPFLQKVWSNPNIGDMSAATLTGVCLLMVLSPTLVYEPVRRFFRTPKR